MLNIVFRVDASTDIGTGHVVRCLTLADQLKKSGAEIIFLCQDVEGNLVSTIVNKGYSVELIQQRKSFASEILSPSERWKSDCEETKHILQQLNMNIDCLIVDHYAIDCNWENELRSHTKAIMVIDDLANRAHDCDLLLDQNLYDNSKARYQTLIGERCQTLCGPEYAMLRTEFAKARRGMSKSYDKTKNILIFFGGSDPTNETTKALRAIEILKDFNLTFDVVTGATNPHHEEIQSKCQQLANVNYHHQITNISDLMAAADLAVGAGGTTTWERCYLGLPTITIITANNQTEVTNTLQKRKAIWNLGWHVNVKPEDIADAVIYAIQHPSEFKDMAHTAFELMGGEDYKGVKEVAEHISALVAKY